MKHRPQQQRGAKLPRRRRSRSVKAIGASAVLAAGLTLAAQPVSAISNFSQFTPLASSVPAGSLPETAPFTLSSPKFSIRTLSANDAGSANGGVKLGDNWDMNTLNENGPQAGRYLFTPYEIGTSGVRRLDLQTGQAITIVNGGFGGGDASRWTPFGTYLTGEEATNGRLFELRNPLLNPATDTANFVHLNVIPRVAQEGLAFDKNNNLYFIDEFNGGKIYRYTSATPNNGSTFFNAGQTSVLKVTGAGDTGAATWVPITDANGAPLPGVNTVTINGVTSVDGRQGGAFVGGTGYNRPEDLEIKTLANGTQILYFAATDGTPTGKVMSVTLTNANNATVKTFVDVNTINKATGLAVGTQFLNPDNLAIDADGNIYILEDIGNIGPAGSDGFDVWFAFDADNDGVAESIGRWASLSTLGAEPTGLYFSPFDPNVAYINVQHTTSDIDRTIEIRATPEPSSLAMLLTGALGFFGWKRRQRS